MTGSSLPLSTRSILLSSRKVLTLASLDQVESELSRSAAELLRRVDDEQQQIAAFDRVVDFLHHALVERVGGLMDAGCVDKDDLPGGTASGAFEVYDAGNRLRVVCGLWVTMASFSPTSAFSRVDLPAFGRPTMETNPDRM